MFQDVRVLFWLLLAAISIDISSPFSKAPPIRGLALTLCSQQSSERIASNQISLNLIPEEMTDVLKTSISVLRIDDNGLFGMMPLAPSDDTAGNEGFPSFLLIPAVFLLGAVSAFAYANMVYTPEILANAEEMRLEQRKLEIKKLIDVVQRHVDEGKDPQDLKKPLEVALAMPVEDYVSAVAEVQSEITANGEETSISARFADIDGELSAILSQIFLSSNENQ